MYVIERLFWESRGMSIKEVVYTEITYVTLISVLEIPFGFLADKLKRKAVLFAAVLFDIAEITLTIYAHNFFHFALVAASAAVGHALAGGTFNSLVYESLQETGEETKFCRILGRINAIDNFTVILALFGGGFIAEAAGMIAAYQLALLSTVVVAVCMALLKEPSVERKKHGYGIRQMISKSLGLTRQNRTLASAVLGGIIINSTIVYLDEFIALHLRDNGLPVWSFGIVMAAAYLSRGAGSLAAGKLGPAAGSRKFFTGALCIFFILQFIFGFVSVWISLAVIVLLYTFWGGLDVLTTSGIHRAAENEFRATAESIYLLAVRLDGLAFGLVFGIISDIAGSGKGLSFSAMIAAVIILTAAGIRKIIRNIKKAPVQAGVFIDGE